MLVFDATPLMYLAKADKLEKIRELDEKKITPYKVYKEVVEKGKAQGKPDAEKIERVVDEKIFEIASEEVEETTQKLSSADLEVLKVAEERTGTAIMDEEYGRKMAEAKNIKTRGTAYIILKMQKENILTKKEAEETIDTIIDSGWYCSTKLYKEITNKIKEIN